MELKTVKIEDILPDPTNPNVMTDKEMERLRYSLRKFGYIQPVIVDEKNTIIDGKHRWRACKDEGKKELDVIVIKNVTELDKKLIRQAMNKIKGSHDPVKDREEFEQLIKEGMKDELMQILDLDKREFDFGEILSDEELKGSNNLDTWDLSLTFGRELKDKVLDSLAEQKGDTNEQKFLLWLGIGG
jgi:hypothetical protein